MMVNDSYLASINFGLFSDGATLYVHGKGAKPRVSKCLIRDSENVGLFVTDEAQVPTLYTRRQSMASYPGPYEVDQLMATALYP